MALDCNRVVQPLLCQKAPVPRPHTARIAYRGATIRGLHTRGWRGEGVLRRVPWPRAGLAGAAARAVSVCKTDTLGTNAPVHGLDPRAPHLHNPARAGQRAHLHYWQKAEHAVENVARDSGKGSGSSLCKTSAHFVRVGSGRSGGKFKTAHQSCVGPWHCLDLRGLGLGPFHTAPLCEDSGAVGHQDANTEPALL